MKEKYNHLNQGKRRILLKPVIDKLSQQATSSESSRIISISGAVKVSGQYPLTKNATYMDLIELAGGYKDDAYIEAAEIRRTQVNTLGSMIVNTSNVDLRQLSKTKLQSRDHLHIRSIKDWDARDTVILGGEIFYPGAYLISPNETLLSVIERAGGFTSESFVGGAIFTRESIKQKEREQLQILGDVIRRDQAARSMTKESEDFSVSSSEVEASISALLSSAVYGRLIIDVPRLMGGDNSADIVLQDGDELNIPKFTNAITVVGEVRRSGSFVLQDSFELNDYLQLAAGMTSRGDRKEIYIIRANGSVRKNNKRSDFLSFNNGQSNKIQAGDTIVVPIKSSYQTPLNLYSTVSQVVFQSIASIAAFSTILN
jgi:protein involved in polysaccharide export with SLBB domain